MPPEPRSSRVDTLLRQAIATLDADDAMLLLAHVLNRPRGWLYAHGDETLQPTEVTRFGTLARQRAEGVPVAYLTGRRGFWTLDLAVSPATLIPRADTERLVELALARLSPEGTARIVDLGTGSGAIALALASERPRARVIATDASGPALDVARANATRLGLGNVEFRLGDWFAAVPGELFDLVASNPPYIADGDPHLAAGDLRFEPASALASGSDGLDAIRTIARAAPAQLAHGGWLLLEHGSTQGKAVAGILEAAGLVDVATEQDLEGRDRVTLGRRRP